MNEAENLPYVFKTLPDWIHEVVLVDGNSTDDTVEVARELWPDVKVVAAARQGQGRRPDHRLRGLHRRHHRDGRRGRLGRRPRDRLLRLGPRLGRRLRQGLPLRQRRRHRRHDPRSASSATGRCAPSSTRKFGARYTDLCYGYNAFWRHCLDKIDLDCTGFEVETLMNIRVVKAGPARCRRSRATSTCASTARAICGPSATGCGCSR